MLFISFKTGIEPDLIVVKAMPPLCGIHPPKRRASRREVRAKARVRNSRVSCALRVLFVRSFRLS